MRWLLLGVLFILFAGSVSAASIMSHDLDGTKLTITYAGTPPFLINIRPDTNIGQPGGYVWAMTMSPSFAIDLAFADTPDDTFCFGVKDSSWAETECIGGDVPGDPVTPYIGGNTGLMMYVLNGMPPPSVFDGGTNPFAIGLAIENVGESDVGSGSDNPYFAFRHEGLFPEDFGMAQADLVQMPEQMLRGAKKNFDGTIMPGDVTNVIWQTLNYHPDLSQNQVHAFRVFACYDYRNYVQTQICMANDTIQDGPSTAICPLSGDKPVWNSGGPLHVVKMTTVPMAPRKVQINFEVQHDGAGEFYGRTATETCDPSTNNANKYVVHVKVLKQGKGGSSMSGEGIVCYRLGSSNEGDLVMFGGVKQLVTCVVDDSLRSSSRIYGLPLSIELSYRYGEFIEDSFVVQAVQS